MSGVVNIRCSVEGCRRLLLSVSEWPADGSEQWSDPSGGAWVELCPKHKEIRPQETIQDANARRDGKGLPPLDRASLMAFAPWSTLRPLQLDARHRQRAVDHLLP